MSDVVVKTRAPRQRVWSELDIARGLNALAAFGGSPTAAMRALKQAFDVDISKDVLRNWREYIHAEEYARIVEERKEDIEAAMVREIRDLARAAIYVERTAIERVMEDLEKGTMREGASQIALNMSKVKVTSIDKMLALTGRPQAITEHRSANELLRSLEAKGVITEIAADERS